MGEGFQRFEQPDEFAREGWRMRNEDYADPVRKAEIDRIIAIRDAVFAHRDDGDLQDSYVSFARSLPKDTRLYHYFIGSTPSADADHFDTADSAVRARIEAFALEHGLEQGPLQ